MKRWILLFFLPCSIEYQIDSIRPGAQYILHSGDYAGIEWTDKTQAKPTESEMDAALLSCRMQQNSLVTPSLEDRIQLLEDKEANLETNVTAIATQNNVSLTPLGDSIK